MKCHHRRFITAVQEPFDFDLTLAFLRGFSPLRGEQRIESAALVISWLVDGQAIRVTIRAGLRCTLASDRALTDETVATIQSRVVAFLSAEERLDGFYEIAAHDEPFAPVARALHGLHHPRFPTPFEAACWGVIHQRIQRVHARRLKSALMARYGTPDAFPEPRALARASHEELETLLGHPRKARAVGAVARAFAEDEGWLGEAPVDEVDRWLRGIHGVGDFTAGFVLYRGLGRPVTAAHAAFTLRSPRLLSAARKTYGRDLTPTGLRAKALRYGPWFGLWALYLQAATFVPAGNGLYGCSPTTL